MSVPSTVAITLDWIQLAIAASALQAVLLAAALAAHKGHRAATRLLAALMAAFAIYLVESVYYAAGMVRTYPHLFGISYPLPWLFGPLVYLYAVTASDAARGFHRRDLLHFIPVIVVVLLALPTYLMSGAEK